MKKWLKTRFSSFIYAHFWICLKTPDGDSERFLVFLPFPNRSGWHFYGFTLLRWNKGECVHLENWLTNHGASLSW